MYVMKSKFARFFIFNGPMGQEKRDMMRGEGSGTGSGTGSGRVLRISSPTPNPNLAIGENPTPIPTPVNSDFPRQNRSGSGAGPTGSVPVAMPIPGEIGVVDYKGCHHGFYRNNVEW